MTYTSEPINLAKSEKFKVSCNGHELAVYSGADFDYVHLITNDFETLTVATADAIERIDIRPSRRRKKYIRLDDHTVTLTVCRGEYLSFELNGDIERPLLIFADEPIPMSVYNGYNVMAFTEPGFYYIGYIELASHTAVYIAEGAVVDIAFHGENVRDIHIFGNGTLLRTDKTKYDSHPINLEHCEDINVNGITIIGRNCWNFKMNACRNVVVENVKILADMVWSDGIDLVGGENVLIRHIFIKNEDDCVCIKSSFSRKGNFKGFNVRNVLVEDCVFWNGPRGNSMEIGYETNNSTVENVMFRNVDIIHRETQENKFHRSIISIHNSGNATVRNIVYENIYAESTDENLVQIAHMNKPNWGEGRGSIENITIRNMTLAGGVLRPSKVSAFAPGDVEPRVTRNITFENLVILGDEIRSREDAIAHAFELDEDSSNVKFL
ncbi:MAG: hypothetical protein IKA82_04035 [Clostridia bacterium]|nr:hypothetical protein [Clostridia bacterium]